MHYVGKVFDIEVEDAHEFVTAFIVHNSAAWGGDVDYSDPLVQMKILGDIAPYSREFQYSEEYAKYLADSGSMTRKGLREYTQASEEARMMRQGYEWNNQLGQTTRISVHVNKVNEDTVELEEYPGMKLQLSGLDMSMIALKAMNDEVSMDLNRKQRHQELLDILEPGAEFTLITAKDELGRFVDDQTISGVLMRGSRNINDELVKRNLAVRTSDQRPEAGIFLKPVDRLFRKYFDFISHSNFAMTNKFSSLYSAIEHYEKRQILGRSFQSWQAPIESYLRPWARIWGKRLGLYKGIPDEVRERWEIEEYFDKFKYLKYKQLEAQAGMNQDPEGAKRARREWESTMAATTSRSTQWDIRNALPSRYREYYPSFEGASTEAERQRILQIVPTEVGRILRTRWRAKREMYLKSQIQAGQDKPEYQEELKLLSQYTEGGRELSLSHSWELYKRQGKGDMGYEEWLISRDVETMARRHGLPPPDSVAWDERIHMKDVQTRILENAGKNVHDFDLWDDEQRLAEAGQYEVPDLSGPSGDIRMVDEGLEGARISTYPSMDNQTNITMIRDYQRDVKDIGVMQQRDLRKARRLLYMRGS